MSYNTGPKIVTDGLVLCLDAADRNSYPGTGTSWGDLSGNGNNGTLTNGPTFTSANGGCLDFDGSDDYVFIDDSSTLTMTELTIDVWFNVDDFTTTQYGQEVFSSYDAGGREYYGIRVEGGDLRPTKWVQYYYDTNDAYGFKLIHSTSTMVTNAWYYATMTWKAGTFHRAYFNGLLETEDTNVSSNNLDPTTGFWLGANTGTTSHVKFNGKIAKASIYNRALSADEISQNYNATKGRFGL